MPLKSVKYRTPIEIMANFVDTSDIRFVLYLFKLYFFCPRSRKRRPSFSHDSDLYLSGFQDDEQMDECNAALVLMSLSGSPHSPRPWTLGSSPASNSSGSWTSCSEELSDESVISQQCSSINKKMNKNSSTINSVKPSQYGHSNHSNMQSNRLRTASLSTSDEGIVMDYSDEATRKRRVS